MNKRSCSLKSPPCPIQVLVIQDDLMCRSSEFLYFSATVTQLLTTTNHIVTVPNRMGLVHHFLNFRIVISTHVHAMRLRLLPVRQFHKTSLELVRQPQPTFHPIIHFFKSKNMLGVRRPACSSRRTTKNSRSVTFS